jgi:transposase
LVAGKDVPVLPAFPLEFRRRAVELFRERDRPVAQLAAEHGISESGLWRWAAQDDVDTGGAEGVSSDEKAELAQLRRGKRRLEMENEILRRAAAYFARENVLPNDLLDRRTGRSASSSRTRSSSGSWPWYNPRRRHFALGSARPSRTGLA